MPQPIVVIAGPTASGKTAMAIDIAGEFTGTVINADSMQVYKELHVLTARPDATDEARVPHRLFGVLSAAEICSAGRWLEIATAEIALAHAADRLPVIVGGTGLYLKALMEGLASVPKIADDVRRETRALHARLGGQAFHVALAEKDPDAAARIAAGDTQRLIRAYEVVVGTGRPLSHWQRQTDAVPAPPGRFATIILMPPRETLYATIDVRFDAMIEAGALDEVAALDALGADPGVPAMKALGVKELRRYRNGECSLDEASADAKRATRNFAKRQITWLRHQIQGKIVSAQYSARLCEEIISFIRQFLLTGPP
jgi:tRNA dimethylallyltransferase